jgi:hypothetical protein
MDKKLSWTGIYKSISAKLSQHACTEISKKKVLKLQQPVSLQLHHMPQADQLQAQSMPFHQGQAIPKLASGGGR